jgi:hypothetical protein
MPACRLLCLLLLALLHLLPAAGGATESTNPNGDTEAQVQLYLFWSASCPHCLTARPQIQALVTAHPWITLHDLELTGHPENVDRYVAMAAALGEEASAVPALLYCGNLQVGWDSAPESAEHLLQALRACRRGDAAAVPGTSLPHLPWLGEIDPASLSLPMLTVLIAGMDAFNPCAFFVLLFLLSLLVHQQDRQRMLLIGLVFVGISGLMYFAFMSAWLGLFVIMGGLPWVSGAAGGVALLVGVLNIKDFVAFGKGPSLSIPDSGRADIFQRARTVLKSDSLPAMLAATVLLGVAANFYELLCTAGFPMVYTRLLTLQVDSPAQRYAWLALYNLIYVLPLLAIVIAFVRTMGARKLSEREGRLLKLLSGLMMLGLGVCLIVAPERLDDPRLALGLVLAAIGGTWLAARIDAFWKHK